MVKEIIEVLPLPVEGNIQVGTRVTEDGVSLIHYELYGPGQKDQFLVAVPDGQPYVDAVGWTE